MSAFIPSATLKRFVSSMLRNGGLFCIFCLSAIQTHAAEPASSSKKNVLIETKVTGTQEQPKVLYIMPWQGITNPVAIQDTDMQITLPEFNPIHPKQFQQQVREFSLNKSKANND